MTCNEIADKLTGNAESDIAILTSLMLSEKDRNTKRTIIEMLDRVNGYASLCECGVHMEIDYKDFIMGNCPFDMPSDEMLDAFRETLDRANKGDAVAEYEIAMVYLNGTFGLPDVETAVKMLKSAAQKGEPHAKYELGVCYINGEGVDLDYAEAVKCFESAANDGNVDAMMELGAIYRGGKGIAEDLDSAFKWYRRAAESGSAEGYLHLGICTFNGSGTEASVEKAIEYVQTAEKMGSSDAKMLLKRMQRYYEEGDIDADEIASRN